MDSLINFIQTKFHDPAFVTLFICTIIPSVLSFILPRKKTIEYGMLIYNSLGQLQSISALKQELGYSLNIQNLLPGFYTVKCGLKSVKLVVE